MKNLFLPKNLLIGVLCLAAFFRLWQLDKVPPSASLDESSIGYNAYSVLKIGVDEYGQFPFLSQRGYDDYRRSTYLFLTIPFIAVLGLQPIAVRAPAVILSLLTIFATYYIVLILFKHSKFSQHVALLTAFLLAISPWHVYISRLGHESNAYLSFLVFGVLFFLQGLERGRRLILAAIFLTLSMVSYYSGQVLVPLFILGLFLIYGKKLISIIFSDRKLLLSLISCIAIIIPITFIIFSPSSLIRFQGTSTFALESHAQEYAKEVELRNAAVKNHDIVGALFYNRHLFPVKIFIQGYISHFQIPWLFTNSGKEPFKIPGLGLLYAWELPFILVGIVSLIRTKDVNAKTKCFIFLWFLLAPVPASVATQAPHAMRSYAFLPTWQIFSAFGFLTIFLFLKIHLKFFPIILLILGFSATYQLYPGYFEHFPREQSSSFQYALVQAIPFVMQNKDRYDRIIFSNQNNLYQSYMFFLFLTKYDPRLYQKEGGTKSGGFAESHRFGKFEFRPISWSNEQANGNTLYIGNIMDFPKTISPVLVAKNLDGSPAVEIVSK